MHANEMHSVSGNIEVMVYGKTRKVIEELFQSLLERYQIKSERSIKGIGFIFDYVNSLYYKCHNWKLNRGESYRGTPDWIKKSKTSINPVSDDDRCFQYAATVALHHEVSWKHPQII